MRDSERPTNQGRPSARDYEAALTLAMRAPSLHNTQPWRWTVTDEGLELRVDRTRQLPVTDMDGHGALLACGACLQLARLGLLACGWTSSVRRFPDPNDPDLLAVVSTDERVEVTEEVLQIAHAAARRRSERRPFDPRPVPDWMLDQLSAAAAEPGVYLDFVVRPDDRLQLAVAAAWADREERQDRGYVDELSEWTHKEAEAGEGIPPSVVLHREEDGVRQTEVPVRDFELGVLGEVPMVTGGEEQPLFGVVFTTSDDQESRLRAGEALVRVLVRAESLGLAASMVSQPMDFPGVRERVRMLMSWVDHPHMLIRFGWPPKAEPGPPSPRRGLPEVITDQRS